MMKDSVGTQLTASAGDDSRAAVSGGQEAATEGRPTGAPGLPDRKNEDWHYGDARRFDADGLEPAAVDRPAPPELCALAQRLCLPGVACYELAGGKPKRLSDADAPEGVTVAGIASDAQAETLLRPNQADYFALQHASLGTAGVVIRAARNSAVGELHLLRTAGPDGSVSADTLLVLAEQHSTLNVYLHLFGGAAESRSLHSSRAVVRVADGARVTLTEIQHAGARTDALLRTHAHVGRDGSFTSVAIQLGGLNVRSEVDCSLSAPGSSAKMLGAYIADGRQRFDFLTHQNHQAPNANSNLLYKGALLGRSRASYQGMITVAEDAQRTDAYQSNRTLVLSKSARADSSPQLEIGANDVRCTHGSTVSNVGAEELFYLQTRGLPREHARRLLVTAFLGEVVDQIASEPLRQHVYGHILERYR